MSEVSIELIKASPFQPRMVFNIEDIKGSIMRDGISVPLTVRQIGKYYELIDGERRLRVAKELGFKTVPITINNVSDEVARRLVWKVNTLRQDYTPKEKAYYFRKLQESGMSLNGIARECDYATMAVVAHLNVFKLPEKYQNLVWDGKISVTAHIQPLSPMFNGTLISVVKWLDQILDRKLTFDELRKSIKPELEEIERKRVESAKEAVGKIESEVKAPETPDELDKASQALKREAKRKRESKKTPEQKAEEAEEKKMKAEEAKAKAEKKKLMEEEERKRREEELRKKIEKEIVKRNQEEVKAELLEDSGFRLEAIQRDRAETVKTLMEDRGVEQIWSVEKADEAQDTMNKLVKIYETMHGWGVNQYVIIVKAKRLNEAHELMRKIEDMALKWRITKYV